MHKLKEHQEREQEVWLSGSGELIAGEREVELGGLWELRRVAGKDGRCLMLRVSKKLRIGNDLRELTM